ncbi:hypothetical protein U5640_15905 [Streptomyces sp. SS7]|uniref:hypothetical protein n=1 Tax=Streptomyces sp. SS7 TaxID=3108485 RepID=UPI0030EF902B
MEQITVTPAMVRAIEGATRFAHGWEIGGHARMLRAMAARKLIRMHAAGGTLTGRGLAVKGHLDQDGKRRTFTAQELDGVVIEWQPGTMADVLRGHLIRRSEDQEPVRVSEKRRHLGGKETWLVCEDQHTGAEVPGLIAPPSAPIEIGTARAVPLTAGATQ